MSGFTALIGAGDAAGWSDGEAVLGGDAEPHSRDGRVWIVADARIDGVTVPYADAILDAYERFGEQAPEHLIGDFALAIWDAPRRRLFCARDHFGLIPLYYARPRGGGIVVGNVLRALLGHPGVSDTLDERAIGDFLLFRHNRDLGGTVYADVRAVPPAHSLSWADRTLRLRRYWAPAAEGRPVDERPAERTTRFTHLLDQAVGDRLRDERAVGTHLSGGLDSTTLAVAARDILRRRGADYDLRAFTIVSTELADADREGEYARQVAARLSIPIEFVEMEDHLLREREGGWAFPEPTPAANHSPDYEVARRVSEFAGLLLVGMGGDPLLHAAPRLPTTPRGWLDALQFAGRGVLMERRRPRLGIRLALMRRRGTWPPPAPTLPDWIDPEFARRAQLEERLRSEWGRDLSLPDRQKMLHPMWPAMFAAAHPSAGGLPLRMVFPFFDLRLVEYVWSVPAYPWRSSKHLLREAMRGRLPEAVRVRPKTPFFDPRTSPLAANPRHRLALRSEEQRRRRRLLGTPGLGEYVDLARARALVDAPVPHAGGPSFDLVFELTDWLATRS